MMSKPKIMEPYFKITFLRSRESFAFHNLMELAIIKGITKIVITPIIVGKFLL